MPPTACLITSFIASLLLLAPPATPAAEEPHETPGQLEARGPDGRAVGLCPLEHTDVRAEISGFVARVRVTQRFANPYPDPIEAVYTFPLPEQAAVDSMWIRAGERRIRGEIERREEARRIYEAARARGQLAALLDQERPNVFTQSVANLMPGDPVEITLEYVELLRFDAGAFELSFPTVVGPRFIPGRATGHGGTGRSPDTTRVPDASRITPPVAPEGTRAGHDLSIRVEIDAGVPIRDLESRLHEIDVERPAPDRALVRLRRRDEIPNRDFVLRYQVAGDSIRSGLLTHADGRRDGYATFLILPPRRVTPETTAPKEMIFVIDRSGSQSGLPLLKAKETLLWILDHMNPNDTFQVVDFGSTTSMLFARPEPASPGMKRRARAYIEALRADGGTLMAEAVQRVCALPADDHRLRIVTFMTDGYVGNDLEVIDLVRRLRGTSRWFPFGTGNSVNRFLLEAMAREGGGEVDYVLLDEPGERVARTFYDRIRSPVLTDVRLDFRGLDVRQIYPSRVSDVWAERPLLVHARYRRPGRGQVIVRGYRAGRPFEQAIEVELPREEPGNAALASLWARARVEDLLSRDLAALQSGTFPERLREEVVQVALEHRLVTPFTSFVAVEDRVVNQGGVQRTVAVPVEMPQGVLREGVFGEGSSRGPGPVPLSGMGKSLLRAAPGRTRELALAPREGAGDLQAPASEPLPPRLEESVARRLGPELLALLERRAGPATRRLVVDGRIRVRVRLDTTSGETLQALQEAGLEIDLVTEDRATGRIRVDALAALAALEGVERIRVV